MVGCSAWLTWNKRRGEVRQGLRLTSGVLGKEILVLGGIKYNYSSTVFFQLLTHLPTPQWDVGGNTKSPWTWDRALQWLLWVKLSWPLGSPHRGCHCRHLATYQHNKFEVKGQTFLCFIGPRPKVIPGFSLSPCAAGHPDREWKCFQNERLTAKECMVSSDQK